MPHAGVVHTSRVRTQAHSEARSLGGYSSWWCDKMSEYCRRQSCLPSSVHIRVHMYVRVTMKIAFSADTSIYCHLSNLSSKLGPRSTKTPVGLRVQGTFDSLLLAEREGVEAPIAVEAVRPCSPSCRPNKLPTATAGKSEVAFFVRASASGEFMGLFRRRGFGCLSTRQRSARSSHSHMSCCIVR